MALTRLNPPPPPPLVGIRLPPPVSKPRGHAPATASQAAGVLPLPSRNPALPVGLNARWYCSRSANSLPVSANNGFRRHRVAGRVVISQCQHGPEYTHKQAAGVSTSSPRAYGRQGVMCDTRRQTYKQVCYLSQQTVGTSGRIHRPVFGYPERVTDSAFLE